MGRYVPQTLIRAAWGRGHVHIKLLGDLPVGSGALAEARLAARYLGKYAGKAVDGERPAGLHRYEVAQGFKVAPIQLEGASAEGVLEQASGVMGAAPSHVWHSSRAEGWSAPPACWAAWDD